ncbi:hypothetical protein RG47T_0171 [Mucilaginibacter polytrichastri]|uniref:Uncharacterized protein n=1 Tax=Mucilaginibacter polytrichastri TaxID=1302689 RepID=A0A1Q5ZST3_9SPHI|nr:hypothetical protein RG47T_0171 [Mucilaginibacter polytrichastri]
MGIRIDAALPAAHKRRRIKDSSTLIRFRCILKCNEEN